MTSDIKTEGQRKRSADITSPCYLATLRIIAESPPKSNETVLRQPSLFRYPKQDVTFAGFDCSTWQKLARGETRGGCTPDGNIIK